MKQHKQYRARATPDARDIFTHGRRFLLAEEHLRDKMDLGSVSGLSRAHWLALPSNVLAAFACELFLKALIVMDGQPVPEVHNLKALYKRLHNKKKSHIDHMWAEQVQREAHIYDQFKEVSGVDLPRDLKGALSDCADAFTLIRYYYEDSSKVKFYITALPRMLHAYILELKPEWE